MYRRARRRRVRSSRLDSVRQTLGVIVVGVLLGTGLFAAGEYISARQRANAAAAAAANDEEIYTGSILYMPEEGRTCHQLLFDNQTGRLTDNGNVDCESAAYHGFGGGLPKQWSAARVRVIADGFRQH
jgi:hypothetical protein